ncbi:MAG: hypothetical protein ACRC0L_10830, partial [Angustibacter sp.]
MRLARPLRSRIRGLAFAIAAVALSTTAHTLGHGVPPRPGQLLALLLAVWLLSSVLVRRTRGVRSIGLGLATIQGLLHVSFVALASRGCAPAWPTGHGSHSTLDPSALAGCTEHSFFPTAGMLGWHLLATLATAGALAYGERLLHRRVN